MNGFHIAATIAGVIYLSYVLIVVGRLTGHPAAAAVLQPLHSIILSGLYTGITLAVIAAGRLYDRRTAERREAAWCKAMKDRWDAEDEWRTAEQAARVAHETAQNRWMGEVHETLAGMKPQRRLEDEDTRPLAGRVVYASIASTNGGQIAAFGDALTRQVEVGLDRFRAGVAGVLQDADERIDGRLADIEKLAANQPRLNGANVVGWPLNPR